MFRKQTGFTLIEIIIVIAVMAILLGASIYSLRPFQTQTALDAQAQEIISALRLAQSRTLASENATSSGVYFETNRFIVFKGALFNPTAQNNEIHNIDPKLRASQISLNNSSTSIVFMRLDGATENYGFIKIETAADAARNKTIFIDAAGNATVTGAGNSDGGRLKDTRHAHILFSQNVKNATTLSINFPENGVTQNIAFQDFLNADKTEFNWKGNIIVAGASQQLKIRTHGLTDSAALFSVQRDRRRNDKAVGISIDGQNLINYAASGAATQGASLWAGPPEIQ